MNRLLLATLAGLSMVLGACARPGTELARKGDEIVACGRLFHTGAPVVLWTDPGGYDAYRTEKRFVPWAKAAWTPPAKSDDGPGSPNRYGVRFVPRADKVGGAGAEATTGPLSEEQFEHIRGGGWDLDLLREHVDQFVLHYDVCGVSRQCFRILHDVRGLSVQFMLDIDGTIYQTMDLKERAWHATSSNDRSVGVEIANIGAYSEKEKDPFGQWYAHEEAPAKRTRITIPDRLGDGGVRTPGFVGYTDRAEPIVGEIQGRAMRQYDLTPQQYDSLTKLTAALHRVLPKIELDYPRCECGLLVTHQLDKDRLAEFRGVLGHYHIQKEKTDPGPALQWDRVINGARRLDGEPALPRGDWINEQVIGAPAKVGGVELVMLESAGDLAASRIGVCSWSLRPSSARDLAAGVARFGVARVQLALDPIRENRPGWGEIETMQATHGAGIQIVSGMMATHGEDYSTLESIARTGGVRPEATWGANFRAAEQNARLARRLGIHLVTFHAGFIPHEANAEREKLIRRIRQIVDVFDDAGVRVAFETGQESADTLLSALNELDRPHAGVNFDPANMILYGMGDPVAALVKLAPRVIQVHIKDAKPTFKPGTWGEEVVAGTGAVDWAKFFDALHSGGFAGTLIVEREAGERRLEDAIAARELIASHFRRLGVQGARP